MKILITGPTGNIGSELIKKIAKESNKNIDIIAGVRNILGEKKTIPQNKILFKIFDFNNIKSYTNALENIDVVFLLRPPHIVNIKKHFEPLIKIAKIQKVKHIVFLSVQGADKIPFIPHHKIEKLIINSQINYTFIRPSYFMQNLTTTLKNDLEKGIIFLPAGNAAFNYIDILDIADFCNEIIKNKENHINKSYTLTGKKNYSFNDIVFLLKDLAKINVIYKSPNPICFLFKQRLKGKSLSESLAVLLIHFFQRFQKKPKIVKDFEKVMNKNTRTLEDFIQRTYNQTNKFNT